MESSSLASSDEEAYEPEYEAECFNVARRFQIRLLAVVPPPLEYMMSLHASQQEISGRQVWCGSLVLAHALVQQVAQEPSYFMGKRILELGSGTGLVGILISKLIAEQQVTIQDNGNASCSSVVVLTDGDEEAMRLLHQNLADPYNTIDSDVVKATYLRWNEQLDTFDQWCCQNGILRESLLRPKPESDDNSEIQFDFIVAGDVMYKKDLPLIFFQTAQRYLRSSSSSDTDCGGVLWLCHIPRSTVSHQVVIDAAVAMGFIIVPVDTHDLVVEDCPLEDLDRAIVYKITRP